MDETLVRSVSLPLDAVTQRFLLLCLGSLWRREALVQAVDLARREPIHWETLGAYAGRTGVAPVLYDCVRDRNIAPAPVEQTLALAYQQSAMDNALLSVELERLSAHLARADLPAIVLKGAALGDTLYGNSALRPMTDIDLLLHPEDVARALDLLRGHGYAWNEVEARPGVRLGFENELMLRAPGRAPVSIELHWHLIDSPFYQQRVPESWFWQTSRQVTLAQTQALVLGLEANLLYLSAHYVLHHRAQGLRWLVDIAALIASQPAQIDWQLLLAQAQAFYLVAPLQIVLAQLAEAWDIPIEPAVVAAAYSLPISAEERHVITPLLAGHRPVLKRFWADLASMPDWRMRLRYGAAHLFPSPAYMRNRYRPDHAWALPLTYPYRWLLGVKELIASPPAQPGADHSP